MSRSSEGSRNRPPASKDSYGTLTAVGMCPGSHGAQLLMSTAASLVLWVPSPHSSHKAAESAPLFSAGMNLPAAHLEQVVEAREALNVPGEHCSHRAAPSRGWCDPRGHEVHAAGDDCRSSALARPAGQRPHEAPGAGL